LTLRYSDGSQHSQFIEQGRNVGSWWEPKDSKYNREGPRVSDIMRIAWQKSAPGLPNAGIYVTGFTNPHPEQEIESLVFRTGLSDDTRWMVLAATLSSGPVFFEPYDDLSSGIPDGWNSAIAWAILEGLAGIKDDGVAFSRTVIAPRWAAAGVDEASVTLRYPASLGYCSYAYHHNAAENRLQLEFTGSAANFELRVLLPENSVVHSAVLDGNPCALTTHVIENSRYAAVNVKTAGVHRAEFLLQRE
jgi:hypothetical protein